MGEREEIELGQRVQRIWRAYEAEPPTEVVKWAGYIFERSAEGPWELTGVDADHR